MRINTPEFPCKRNMFSMSRFLNALTMNLNLKSVWVGVVRMESLFANGIIQHLHRQTVAEASTL